MSSSYDLRDQQDSDVEHVDASDRFGGDSPAHSPARAGALFRWSLIRILLILSVLWAIRVLEQMRDLDLTAYGLYPRTAEGLWGILTMPFLHGDIDHLYHNSFSLFLLGLCLFFFYPKVVWRVLVLSTLLGGALVWALARPSYHIGASGVVYSISAFLFVSGLVRGDRMSRGAALLVMLNYGASIWGLFPLQQGVSWEGHLFGAIAGTLLALVYRKVDLPVPESWPDEPDEEQRDEEMQDPPEYDWEPKAANVEELRDER